MYNAHLKLNLIFPIYSLVLRRRPTSLFLLLTSTLLLLLSSTTHFASGQFAEEGVCPTESQGEDDLPAFDFFSRLGLNGASVSVPGIRRITGTNKLQTAYR